MNLEKGTYFSALAEKLFLQRDNKFLHPLFVLGELFYLLKLSMQSTFSRPFYWARTCEQIVLLGVGSLSITAVIGLCMGLVMALNFGYGLSKFGGTLYVPAVVSLSIVRELAPTFTSLLVAGRIGSGMAAELGSMNVNQQIDALRALGTSPIRVLVVPRFWAAVISMPLLTAFSATLGVLGGMIICYTDFDIPSGFYMNKVLDTIRMEDYISSMIKSAIFGGIIAIFGCYKGLKTKHGTRGVGNSTTWVVVFSSITILVTNFFLSKLFLAMWGQ